MRVLVACEFSGRVRDAFAKRGHDAWSCDLLPSEKPGNHIEGDVTQHLRGWDLIISHPPCTYFCVSGNKWMNDPRYPDREERRMKAWEFVISLIDAPTDKYCIENPIGILSTWWRKPDQIIQPYNFGHDASKSTCLWLKGIPKLKNTRYVQPRIVNGKRRWANQSDITGSNMELPSPDRWKNRSRTFEGIADAMADQWG